MPSMRRVQKSMLAKKDATAIALAALRPPMAEPEPEPEPEPPWLAAPI